MFFSRIPAELLPDRKKLKTLLHLSSHNELIDMFLQNKTILLRPHLTTALSALPPKQIAQNALGGRNTYCGSCGISVIAL